MLGPPGAGKGTQGYRLSRAWQVPHIASGDLLRRVIEEEDSELARAARVIHEGEMVSDEIASAVVFRELEASSGFVLDGYPRNVAQAQTLNQFLEAHETALDAVLLLRLSEQEILRRLGGRLTCVNCGESFHTASEPPRQPGICDRCGGNLVVREDDHPDRVRVRLALYAERTEPVIQFYRNRGVLREVDAEGSEDEVFLRCQQVVGVNQ